MNITEDDTGFGALVVTVLTETRLVRSRCRSKTLVPFTSRNLPTSQLSSHLGFGGGTETRSVGRGLDSRGGRAENVGTAVWFIDMYRGLVMRGSVFFFDISRASRVTRQKGAAEARTGFICFPWKECRDLPGIEPRITGLVLPRVTVRATRDARTVSVAYLPANETRGRKPLLRVGVFPHFRDVEDCLPIREVPWTSTRDTRDVLPLEILLWVVLPPRTRTSPLNNWQRRTRSRGEFFVRSFWG